MITKFDILTASDLDHISHLQPADWSNIMPRMKYYVDSPFCMPIKAIVGNRIGGIGAGILNEGSGWIANIIVDPELRKQGIGTKITEQVISFLEERNCQTLLLVATNLGEPVYEKLGFRIENYYLMFEGRQLEPVSSSFIVPFESWMTNELFDLDCMVSGEVRKQILEDYLEGCLVYRNTSIEGFYLPEFGEGMIVAGTNGAGIELLRYKLSLKNEKIALPEENLKGIEFLMKHGFTEFRRASRMHRGKRINWKPSGIFSRSGGHYG